MFRLTPLTGAEGTSTSPECSDAPLGEPGAEAHQLHYRTPTSRWEEGLPLGNGSLGAMVLSSAGILRLVINDDTAWSGSPRSELTGDLIGTDGAREALADVRALVDAGEFVSAGEALKAFQHRHSQSFLPFADLVIRATDGHDPVRFTRGLDLRTATHETADGRPGECTRQRTWISRPHRVLVHEITSESPRNFALTVTSKLRVLDQVVTPRAFAVTLQMPSDVAPPHDDPAEPVVYDDTPGASLRGALVLQVSHDGRARSSGSELHLEGVTDVKLVLATATTFEGSTSAIRGDERDALVAARSLLQTAVDEGVDAVREAQVADHASLYQRAELTAGSKSVPCGDVAERLVAINDDTAAAPEKDPALIALLFNYGRYLLISSSRPGSLPANLQGIWNQDMRPVWSSNYTTNINVQMNYWPASTTNLAETEEPLFDLIRALSDTGRRTARRLYGAQGWVAHHNTDAWAYSLPVGSGTHDPKWAFGPMAGLWLARHIDDHDAFLGDDALLTDMFDVLRGAAEFALDWLVKGPDGRWGTNPSTSPENTFRTAHGQVASVASSSAFDLDLIRDHFRVLIAAADRLNITDTVVERVRVVVPDLRTPRIGADGTLAEWDGDFEQDDPFHRHLSPLLPLYPGNVQPDATWIEAATKLLDQRGDDATGWSLAWKIALRSRLRQPAAIDRLLPLVFRDMAIDRGEWRGGLYPNMLVAHPPFQIDGNFGFTAGIAEALMQSHRGEIELLPALPTALPEGRVRGLVARPGVDVEISWEAGQQGEVLLTSALLRARHERASGTRRVRWRNRAIEVDLVVDETVEVASQLAGRAVDPD